jgi:hypothetical protein
MFVSQGAYAPRGTGRDNKLVVIGAKTEVSEANAIWINADQISINQTGSGFVKFVKHGRR